MKRFLTATLFLLTLAPARADSPAVSAQADKVAAAMPAGASPWSEKKFLHPPLKCMEPYTRIDEYPVMAWAFHGRGSPGYDVEFVKQAELSGFNVLVDAAAMLKPCEQSHDMKLMAIVFRFPPERITKEVFDQFGDHPRLLGLLLDDNCPRIYPWSITASNWMRENYPHLVPWISKNPNPRAQSRTAIRILGSQNYWITRAGGAWGRQAFCSGLGRDRDNGNAMNMTFWPLISSPAAPAAVRFEAFAAAAHGAQGVCYFAYCPGDRWPQWKAPQGTVAQAAAEANNYLRKVAGWHIWGTRCLGVLHGPHDGDVPQNAGHAGPGQVIEAMDDDLLAGLLLPEKEFLAPAAEGKTKLPMYAFVVNKRFGGPRRTVHIAFSPDVRNVEVFPPLGGADSNRPRIIEAGWSVPLELEPGGGLLVRLNPEHLGDLFRDGQKTYDSLLESLAILHRHIDEESASLDEFNHALAAARGALATLRQQQDTLKDDGQGQRRDVLDRLERSITELRIAVLQPRFATPGEPFSDSIDVQLRSRIKGSDIRFTLDGSEPTLHSPRYTGPIRLNRTATVRARGAASEPPELVAEDVTSEFTLSKSDLAQPHRIIFQPRDPSAASSQMRDSGDAYGARECGYAFGWDRDRTRAAVAWKGQEDPSLGGGVELASGAHWKHLVRNGRYDVTLSFGDAKRPTHDAIITVDGVEFFADRALAAGEFAKITHEVTVNDGKLTLEARAPKAPRRGRVQFAATLNFVELHDK